MAEKKTRRTKAEGGSPPSKSPPVSKRSKQLSRAIRSMEGFQIWSEVPPPLVCPTRITSLNRGMKCGGIPGGMLGVLHGPSQGGKTLLLAEILYSVWASGGWGLFGDAECRGVDLKWFSTICGSLDEVAYCKPKTFEQFIAQVEEFRGKFRVAKEKGEVPPGAFLGIGIDSVNRLTPRTELEELLKGKVEARGYPLRALLTSKWLDKIIPTLERDEILACVMREGKKLDAMPGQKTYTVKGGVAAIYDGGWILRVTSATKIRAEDKGEKKGPLIGEKHEIEVLKNSLGPHLEELAYFYSSVGAKNQTPLGLDFAREVREESLTRGLVKYKASKGYFKDGEVIAASKRDYLKWLQSPASDGELNWYKVSEELNGEFNEEG